MSNSVDITPIVNAVIRVASKPYIDFIQALAADGRITPHEIEQLNEDVANQRLILTDLAKEELARQRRTGDE
ncbi:MAG: hypothetical protein U0Q55_23140 [Vicinamibacterales bacterium]